jgi:energy-coupling factor transporter ATP-binding protein EcfA2
MNNALHSPEREQAILGGLLLDGASLVHCSDLSPTDFFNNTHGLIFGAVVALVNAGQPAGVIEVSEHLKNQPCEFGGRDYLNQLAQFVPSASHIRGHASKIRELAKRRGLIADASNTLIPLSEIVAKLEALPHDGGPNVMSAAAFLGAFKPIESIIEGLPIPRGGVTALTGMTGSGKTTLCTAIEGSLITGKLFAGRRITQGCVLVLAGENPDDYAMHLMATAQDAGIATADLENLFVVAGVFALAKGLAPLKRALAGCELVAVIVDTSVAFNGRGDENGNIEQHDHAIDLRSLTTLPGNPAVVVLCHPKLNPTRETLYPRGGGAFMNEIDANLTVWKDPSGIHTLHWCGKIRGSNFDPIDFEMVPVELAGHKDHRGNPIVSTAARHVSHERAEVIESKALSDENTLLLAMWRNSGASVSTLAMKCGWTSATSQPQKSRVDRLIKGLFEQKLVSKDRNGSWCLTPKGIKAAEEVR